MSSRNLRSASNPNNPSSSQSSSKPISGRGSKPFIPINKSLNQSSSQPSNKLSSSQPVTKNKSQIQQPLAHRKSVPTPPLTETPQSEAPLLNSLDNLPLNSPKMASTFEGIDIDLSGLSPQSKLLATTIITAVAASMKKQFEEERENYQARITTLEEQVQSLRDMHDDLENYGRRNTIVISGSSLPNVATNENCIDIATQLIIEKLELPTFTRNDIDIAHRLGKPRAGSADKRNLIVKLCRRDNKQKIFQACRLKKPQNIFFNESVSRTRNTILYVLRKARKDFPTKFGLCKTEDGNVRVMLPTSDDPSRFTKETVNTKNALDVLLRTRINGTSAKYDARWDKQ